MAFSQLLRLVLVSFAFVQTNSADSVGSQPDSLFTCESDAAGCDEESANILEVSLLQTGAKLQDAIQAASGANLGVKSEAATSMAEVAGGRTRKAEDGAKAKANEKAKATSNETLQVSPAIPDNVLAACVFSAVAVAAYLVVSNFQPEAQVLRMSALVAEFVGTFVLVFTVNCCARAGSSTWNATAIGFILMAMIYATGPISGANLNPVVSIALGLAEKIAWPIVFQYCAVQVFAGIAASFVACLIFAGTPVAVGPVAPFLWWHAGLIETFYTTMLSFVVLNCAASKSNKPDDSNQFFALAIGFVIIAGGYPAGGISGANFNPAVSLGLEMVTSDSQGWGFVWAFFQCIGAPIAVALFNLVRPEDEKPQADDSDSHLSATCIAEFIGTFTLVFTVGLNIVMHSDAVAWSAAAALVSMIYALGDVSGAHFNPAVTAAICFSGRGKCKPLKGALYICVQVLAGVCASYLYAWVQLHSPSKETAFPLHAGKGFSILGASTGEFIFTALLAYVVLAVATTQPPPSQKSRHNFHFALCIGACVMVGGNCLGTVSGGHLNPAVSMGTFYSDMAFTWANAAKPNPLREANLIANKQPVPLALQPWIPNLKEWTQSTPSGPIICFVLFQMLGGAVASLVFRLTHLVEYLGNQSEISLPNKCLAEFVGTFYLVLTVGFCSLAGSTTWNALAIAMALMVMIYSVGPVSGGNLNPAVSLCLAFCKKLDLKTMLAYCFVQVAAGQLAAITFQAFFDKDVAWNPVGSYTWVHALVVEVIYTVLLCFVVLQCAVSKRNNAPDDGNHFFALAIGFVIVAGGYAAGGISGACFNPAVSLGLDFSGFLQTGAFLNWGIWWSMAQLLSAWLAAKLFEITRPEEFTDGNAINMAAPSLSVKCLSEFLGVFVLVMTVGLNIVTGSKATALSAAAALMCMVYSLGDISGAHFNPAVTLAVVISGRDKCLPSVGASYVIVQLLAAMIAGHLYAAFHMAGPNKDASFPLEPGQGYSFLAAGIVEMFFTCVLAFTVLSTATVAAPRSQRSRQNFFFGLAIASCIVGGGVAIGKVSGGELNPAVSLGIVFGNLAHSGHTGGHASSVLNFLPFSLWQLSGGIVAALIFRFTNANEYGKIGVPVSSAPLAPQPALMQKATTYPSGRVLAFPRVAQ